MIGVGIEYLAQQGFWAIDTDSILNDFDNLFAEQINQRKLYLSYQEVSDLKRFFSARLDNPQTKKRDFLDKTLKDVITLLGLHEKVSVKLEYPQLRKKLPDNPENWGLKGYAGNGLSLLSDINPEHNTWLKLR